MFAHYQIVITFAENFTDNMTVNNTKKRLVTSIHNLTPAQQAEIKALYPLGFAEVMQRIDKPDGTFFCVVPSACTRATCVSPAVPTMPT